jgi:hypothetical protein
MSAWASDMIPARDIVVEREHGDGGLADREGRGGDDGREQPLEPLSRFRQFRRDARDARMDLDADMMGDEPDDALAVGGAQRSPVSADSLRRAGRSKAGRPG